jgi:L-iditol 2-dehydrogenase
MKALVLREYNNFTYEDVPLPEIQNDEVLVRVKACAICGSDVHGMDGSTGRRIPPVIMGHEASGVIEEVGNDVKDYSTGDRVTFDSTIYCGKCYYCLQGKVNLCDDRKVLGVSCQDYRQNGAFAEFVAVPRHILYRLPDAISFERAAMVEPLSVAIHAIKNTPLSVNDTAVVVGAGMIGLLIIQVLKLAGCGKIIAVDLDGNKLEIAEKYGAVMGLIPDSNVISEVLKATKNRGADIAFEVVGITQTVETAIACLKKGGSLTLVGNLSPEVKLPLQKIVTRELALKGTCASSGEYDECLDMIASGRIDIDSFISAVTALSKGALWFDKLHKGEKGLMKVILQP